MVQGPGRSPSAWVRRSLIPGGMEKPAMDRTEGPQIYDGEDAFHPQGRGEPLQV